MEIQAEKQSAVGEVSQDAMSEFDALLKKEFSPKTPKAQAAISSAVQTLAEQASRKR